MKSLYFITFCMITVSLYSFSQSISSYASSTLYPGRRTIREVPISSHDHEKQQNLTRAIDDKAKQSTVQDGSMTVENANSTDDFDEIVYHIDYHGVTTHPTPTPRHDRNREP